MIVKENKKEIIESVSIIFGDTKVEFKCFDGEFYDRYIPSDLNRIKREYRELLIKERIALIDVILFVDMMLTFLDIKYDKKGWDSYINELLDTRGQAETFWVFIDDKETLDYMISNLLKDNMK